MKILRLILTGFIVFLFSGVLTPVTVASATDAAGLQYDVMKVANKVIVVTGAGSGMGRELALELARRGAKVAAVDLRAESLTETAKLVVEIGGTISTHAMDVTDAKAVDALPAAVMKALGDVDGLVNNAGIIQPSVKINDLDFAAAEHVMNVNFYGPLRLIKVFLPNLLKRPEAHILNVSSMGAYAPVPG